MRVEDINEHVLYRPRVKKNGGLNTGDQRSWSDQQHQYSREVKTERPGKSVWAVATVTPDPILPRRVTVGGVTESEERISGPFPSKTVSWIQNPGPHPRNSDSFALAWVQGLCISRSYLHELMAATGVEYTFENLRKEEERVSPWGATAGSQERFFRAEELTEVRLNVCQRMPRVQVRVKTMNLWWPWLVLPWSSPVSLSGIESGAEKVDCGMI